MPSDRAPHAFPEFGNVEEERRHRKQRLAAAFRLFGQLRLRRGNGRPHHGPRPRAVRPLLGQPARHELPADPGQGPPPRQPRGRGGRGQLAAQPGRLRHPLPDPRRPARRRLRGPLPLGLRQGLVDPATTPRSADPGRLRLLRGPRRVRRLHRCRARDRGGQAHRPRPRRPQGGHPGQPRPAHRRSHGGRGGLVVHHDGAHVPGPAAGRGGRHPGAHRPRRWPRRPPDRPAATAPAGLSSSPSTTSIVAEEPDLLDE